MTTGITVPVAEPAILAANTYFWKPSANATSRRRAERMNLGTVEDYLSALGFETHMTDCAVHAERAGVSVTFTYSESCRNVYKALSVIRDGRTSNITTLRKIAKTIAA